MSLPAVVVGLVVGVNLWLLFEYLLHRFAMHHLHGRGIMSREHLEHHVTAGWSFSYLTALAWLGIALVGFAWYPGASWVGGAAFGWAVSAGWVAAYAFYEWEHAMCHLRPPRTRYQRWVRKHHFQHHFGRPMSNQGVTVAFWDIAFGTNDPAAQVRVPRRLAAGLGWLIDDDGELRPEFAGDYVLVGSADSSERQQQIDRVKAFASVAPDD